MRKPLEYTSGEYVETLAALVNQLGGQATVSGYEYRAAEKWIKKGRLMAELDTENGTIHFSLKGKKVRI